MNGKTEREVRDKEIRLHWRFLVSYKKNTLAVFFSFVLTFMLTTIMLVLIHTNHRIENIQSKTIFTPSDCSISEISKREIAKLKRDSSIDILAVEQVTQDYTRNGQIFGLTREDHTAITMMATIIEGRLPEEKNEVVAEKWVLLNLGIEPVLDEEFVIQNYGNEQLETVKLVGILSDIPRNKQYGTRDLYAPIDEDLKIENIDVERYAAYLHFKAYVDYKQKVKSLISELGIKKKQIRKCPAREDFKELYDIDIQVISLILLICMIVFYGIYRITLAVKQKQYGILRALGMKKGQLRNMILLELYSIYAISVPIGFGAGLLLAFFIVKISGDGDSIVYLYNEMVRFSPVIPMKQIAFCIVFIAIFIGIVGIIAARKIIQKPVVEAISETMSKKGHRFSIIKIRKRGGKLSTLFLMGFKYIFQDVKTSAFLVLTICTGMALFTGLSYRANILKLYREDTRETWRLNGQYEMSMLGFENANEGVSRKSMEKMETLSGISKIKTASGVRVRVIDEDKRERNDTYYDELNKNFKKYYGYEFTGNDGENQIYKSILYGYNTEALKELKKYVIAGDFDPENLKEDEIILSILSLDDRRPEEPPSYYREGTPLMKYLLGEEIQIKYRADFNTGELDYETLTDTDSKYIYKTYKIAAIVSFSYMFDCNRTVYPLLITSDQKIRDIMPDSHFQCIYIDGKESMTTKEQIELERQLILIGAENENVSTRSLIAEIKQNEMFYHKQMVYIYGIALASFVLVLINMINNIKYRMQIRTKEICMLRAIGMSIAMIKRMLLFENGILGIISIAAAYFLSWPALKYLYKISDMKLYGHLFHYNYYAFFIISFVALVILAILSRRILASWKTKQIIEAMGSIE